jgi:LysM repeat protein
MKTPKFLTRKKLRAATARRVGDIDEMSEPNMKLSRALLIVLVLHVVAVAGIVAFNSIKAREGSFPAPPPPPAKTETASQNSGAKVEVPTTSTRTTARSTTKDEHKTDRAKTSETTGAVADSGKTYVVAKGDNPVTIAKKLKVPYDDLLAINHIDDPHKLQIGQKLLIPKTAKPKKSGE